MSAEVKGGKHARHDPPLGVLDVVRDRKDDEPADAVVVNTPPVPAEEWVAYNHHGGEVTVAEDNPDYDATANVIVVAFRDELAEARPSFTDTNDALPLSEAGGLDTYAFPPGRLRRVCSICPNDGEESGGNKTDSHTESNTSPGGAGDEANTEPTLRDDLDAIAEAVGEKNVDAVAVDTFREAVVVEKLGIEYLITAEGDVDADDRIADALEAAAEEVVGE